MGSIARTCLVLALAASLVTACGKRGDPVAPGQETPKEQKAS